VLGPDADGARAVIAFTGHAYVLADVDPVDVVAKGADGFGGALAPEFLSWVAGVPAAIGSVDVVLVASGGGEPDGSVVAREDLAEHPRVRRATAHRRDVEVLADQAGLVVLGRGLVGRRELSVELFHPAAGSTGDGRRLIRAGLSHVAAGERCWAQVAAGNAASLRAFLASGFVPVCAEVLIDPA